MKTKTENKSVPVTEQAKNQMNLKTVSFIFLFIMVSFSSMAQFRYGVEANVGGACRSSQFCITDNDDLHLSYGAGLRAEYSFTEDFALRSGISYQLKGRNLKTKTVTLNEQLHYLQLPLLDEFSAGERAGFKHGQSVYFAAGPYLGLLLDANVKKSGHNYDIKNENKTLDPGLTFEVGFEFPVSNHSIRTGIKYEMSLIDASKTSEDLHNKTTVLSIGYFF